MSAFSAQIEANISNFTKNLDKANQDINKFQDNVAKKLDKIGTSFVNIGAKASFLSAGLVAIGTKAFLMASDIEDAIGATEQIFGDNANSVNAWASKLDSSFGVAKKEALEYSNLMGTMLINIGKLTEEEASKQSAKLIELAGDLTAMYGGSTQDAVRALTGALKGNNTMLDNYGMAVNEALIKQKALELGLIGTSGEMTLQAKQGATLALIWEQTGAAQGQAAREADSASGGMRALKTAITNLSTELGEVLLPIITPIISGIREFVSRIRDLSPEAKKVIVVVAGIAAAVGPLLLGLGGLLKILPLIGAGFTAVTGPVGIAIAAVAGAAILIIKNWDSIKEYFTSGGGSELFKSIKALSSNLFDALKTTFNNIKNVVLKVWDSIGSNVIRQLSLVIDTVVKFLTFVTNIINDFLNILRSEPKDVLENLKTFFVNAFTGILDIVKNVLASVTNQLSGFFRLLKLDKWADSLTAFSNKLVPTKKLIDDLTDSTDDLIDSTDGLTGLTDVNPEIDALKKEIDALNKEIERLKKNSNNISTESIIPEGSLKELSEKLKVLYEQLDNETTQSGRIKVSRLINDLENKVVRIKVAIDFENALKPITNTDLGVSPIIDLSPQIDKMGADLDRMKAVFDEKNQALGQGVQMMNQMLVGGFVGMFTSLGDAIGSGENVLGALGKSLVGALGDMAIQVGTLMIGFGKAAEALWKLIASPFGAVAGVAAGAALIALGAAAKSAVSGAIQGGMGGGGYSGGGGYQSTRVNAPIQQGEFQYRDSYSQQQVEFKISGDNLVGVLDKKQTRNNRNV